MIQNGDDTCMLSFDVEDWFHVENLRGSVDRDDWDDLTLRVRENTLILLDLLDRHDCTATFFVLGRIAERDPDLVREIDRRGHEIASHGHGHELVNEISTDRFDADVRQSKRTLQQLVEQPVEGYRAPNYSMTEQALDRLADLGFSYDSSYFPSSFHDRYTELPSVDTAAGAPIQEIRPGLQEVTVSTLDAFGLRLPWAGGGYFRLLPYAVFRSGIRRILSACGTYLFYLHPWEIDPDQPRVDHLSPFRAFRHYYGLEHTLSKLDRLLSDFSFQDIRSAPGLSHRNHTEQNRAENARSHEPQWR